MKAFSSVTFFIWRSVVYFEQDFQDNDLEITIRSRGWYRSQDIKVANAIIYIDDPYKHIHLLPTKNKIEATKNMKKCLQRRHWVKV